MGSPTKVILPQNPSFSQGPPYLPNIDRVTAPMRSARGSVWWVGCSSQEAFLQEFREFQALELAMALKRVDWAKLEFTGHRLHRSPRPIGAQQSSRPVALDAG